MKVGTIVKLKIPCLGNPVGTSGVCYEEYDLGEPGAGSVIFENGRYDGFSPEEQENFLDFVGTSTEISNYQFTNVMKLSEDFESGFFKIFL